MSTQKKYRILYILDSHTSIAPSQDEPSIIVNKLGVTPLNAGDTTAWALVEEADFILLLTHGSTTCFKGLERVFEMLRPSQTFFVHCNMEDEIEILVPRLKISHADYLTIQRYTQCHDSDNATQLHRYLANRFGGLELTYTEARYPRWQGIYSVDKEEEETLLSALLAKKTSGARIIGLLIPFHLIRSQNLKHVESLISQVESLGASVLPVFSTGKEDALTGELGVSTAMGKYFIYNDVVLPDCIINMMPYSLGVFESCGTIWSSGANRPENILTRLDVAILQAYATYYNAEQYQRQVEGLDTISLISSVCYPEFDGQVDGYPIGTREVADDGTAYFAPLQDGIISVARLALRWAELKHKPNDQKRIAIIFHNMPPRNDSIGCAAGLDSPRSVYHVVNRLRQEGVYIPEEYNDGDDIIKRIISAVSNDTSWLSIEEVLERAVDTISAEQYRTWHEGLSTEVQRRLEGNWGSAPGDFKVLDGKMPIPGIINGNIFIGLQAPRGYEEHAEAIYHSTDIVCPHYYIAFYRWVRYVFEADLFIHVGTHGSLEWLPGKEKGLSRSCFPLVNADDMPHLYIYHTAIIGEGIQAKRRSAAVLINHMEPAMTEGGVYGELSSIDALVNKYLTGNVAPAQKPILREDIVTQASAANLLDDLGYTTETIDEDFFTALHNWLAVLKSSMVRDGLHIFGENAEGERMASSIRMLLRLPHGSVPSLLDALARYHGLTEEQLLDKLDCMIDDSRTASMAIDELTEQGRELILYMLNKGFEQLPDKQEFVALLGECSGDIEPLRSVLTFAIKEVYPRLTRICEELDSLYHGSLSGFVLPGKGGSPSRGSLEIIPTGRNMYAIDPCEIPSHSAYAVGIRLGEQLLQRHLEDTGKVPETTAIVLYSGDQMRTYGEDIAEILWLMGLRPKWLSDASDKVVGLEVIPLEDLGRPRLDVVSRISGLLRDTFPTIINLLDDAVRIVVALDESHEDNYIKKHYDEELQQLLADGIDPETAHQEAALRIFGCPPGTYGGGVDVLVESKNWQNSDDLGTAAITWGAHAYSRDSHGLVRREAFERQLSRVEATVKNQNIIGFDLYDIDDEYIYHGGLIAAVRKCSGKQPRSYYGNTSNPARSVVRTLAEESARVIRSRLLNPLWIDGLKKHGYRGAYDVAYNMDNVFGWDATADSVTDWNYEALAQHFLGNEDNRSWLQEVNPWALQEIAQKLLEAAQRGMWDAQAETLAMITEVYLDCEGTLEDKNS